MKRTRNTILTAAIVITTSTAAVIAQADGAKAGAKPSPAPVVVSPEKARSDEAWRKVGTTTEAPEPVNGVRTYNEAIKKWGDGTRTGYLNSPDFYKWFALRRLQYREEGLKFWRDFPDDKRRYEWLMITTNLPPFYWKDTEQASHSAHPSNAPIDEAAIKAWNDIYTVLRSEFMTSAQVTDQQRAQLQYIELLSDVLDAEKSEMTPLVRSNILRQLMARYFDLDRNKYVDDNGLIAGVLLRAIGDDTGAESAFIEGLKLSKHANIQLFAYGREQVAKLRSNPFELKAVGLKDEAIDVAKLRGKIVLVDIWSDSCTACIAAMPKVKAVYDKYRDKGFEVVGVWLSDDVAKEKPAALDILKDKSVNWPNAVMAGDAYKEFCKKYSILSVPVTFLLDRDGKLVTNDVKGSKLEQEVKRLVEAPDVK